MRVNRMLVGLALIVVGIMGFIVGAISTSLTILVVGIVVMVVGFIAMAPWRDQTDVIAERHKGHYKAHPPGERQEQVENDLAALRVRSTHQMEGATPDPISVEVIADNKPRRPLP